MGKSDTIIFEEYKKVLETIKTPFYSTAFLGFSQENNFTKSIKSSIKDFYDLSLGNWNINDQWELEKKYDLIISTRCPYFSKNPKEFILRCKNSLTDDGHALIDWGLGDHWRFQNYKVGWVRNNEQEFAYEKSNFLYSCFWSDELLNDVNVASFWNHVVSNKDFGYFSYENLKDVVQKEVPHLVNYKTKLTKSVFLWPERPQLYIITLFDKKG